MSMAPFHLAFPVTDLEAARAFYVEILACQTGRESEHWIDFNFFGHQITAHLAPETEATGTNEVDGKKVPVRHFGVILEWGAWHSFMDRLKAMKVTFLIEPGIRFQGKTGEQATAFITDPSGNGLEFKSFKDMDQVFKAS